MLRFVLLAICKRMSSPLTACSVIFVFCEFALYLSDNQIVSFSCGRMQNNQSPLDCAAEIAQEADEYNGFNLVLADLCSQTMVYVSNRPKGEPVIQVVPPGLHVLSNANLDTPWPKAQRLSKNFDEYIRRNGEEEIPLRQMVHELMVDTVRADWSALPQTGCDPEWEYDLSSIFINVDTRAGRYGTRSMAAISVKAQGEVDFYERYLENSLWKEHLTHYCIEKLQ